MRTLFTHNFRLSRAVGTAGACSLFALFFVAAIGKCDDRLGGSIRGFLLRNHSQGASRPCSIGSEIFPRVPTRGFSERRQIRSFVPLFSNAVLLLAESRAAGLAASRRRLS